MNPDVRARFETEFAPRIATRLRGLYNPGEVKVDVVPHDGQGSPTCIDVIGLTSTVGAAAEIRIVGGQGARELDHPDASGEQKRTRYAGKGGVALSNPMSRLAYAVTYGDKNILLSDAVGDGSRIIDNRDPSERVKAVAPWLTTDGDVYPSVVDGRVRLDLPYEEDSRAEVDMNVVCTDGGKLIEVQGTAEGAAFGRDVLDAMLDSAQAGCERLFELQREALAARIRARAAETLGVAAETCRLSGDTVETPNGPLPLATLGPLLHSRFVH